MRSCSSIRVALLLCIGAAAFSAAAGDRSLDAARTAYAEGRFAEAAGIAERLGSSEGYALAARSLIVHARYIADDSVSTELLFEEAYELAEKAVAADPRNPDARLQLARALGRMAEAAGPFAAANRNHPQKIREAAETALRLDPGLAAAWLALGAWHAEIVGSAGPFIARVAFGARERDALAAFERALDLAPGMKAAPLQHALGLLALDEDEYREKARALLRRAVEIPARDGYERLIHKEAANRLAALDAPGG